MLLMKISIFHYQPIDHSKQKLHQKKNLYVLCRYDHKHFTFNPAKQDPPPPFTFVAERQALGDRSIHRDRFFLILSDNVMNSVIYVVISTTKSDKHDLINCT